MSKRSKLPKPVKPLMGGETRKTLIKRIRRAGYKLYPEERRSKRTLMQIVRGIF